MISYEMSWAKKKKNYLLIRMRIEIEKDWKNRIEIPEMFIHGNRFLLNIFKILKIPLWPKRSSLV